jgi:hypothetical protein
LARGSNDTGPNETSWVVFKKIEAQRAKGVGKLAKA